MSEITPNYAALGMDLEQSIAQIKKGKLTYALNAMIEGFDGQYVNYQNEMGNELCVTIPEGFKIIGIYAIYEKNLLIYFLTNPNTGESEIGKSNIDGCEYTRIINAHCLNFNIEHPILSAAHRIDNCSTQIFFVDGYNRDRFIDLDNLPFKEVNFGTCENEATSEVDCNKMSINPLFSIPTVDVVQVDGDGTLETGTYQFAVQYANSIGEAYTSVYSITNPTPVFDKNTITLDFNSATNKSISVKIANIDTTGFYDYINIIVVKTVNNISTPQLIGTYKITGPTEEIIYTGQKVFDLSIQEVFQKYPVYTTSNDITEVGDVLVRDQLVTAERLSYQDIANKITINWQTWKVTPDRSYADPLLATDVRGYMRDEVYPFDIVFLLKDGRQTDRFHIPGRKPKDFDLEYIYNNDVVNADLSKCDDPESLPRWKVYNTASVYGIEPSYLDVANKECYAGPYEYGEMAYWESTEEYPCNADIWGELAGQKIRHHKFPDSLVTHIHDNTGNIYPIGIKIDVFQIQLLIQNSALTTDQKNNIAGFKIVRGNRVNNKSVVAKGLLRNVGKYEKDDTSYYFPNYPFNDLREDPFIQNSANFFGEHSQSRFTFQSPDTSFYQPFLGNTLKLETAEYGDVQSHFVPVKDHAKYKLFNAGLYLTSLTLGIGVSGLDAISKPPPNFFPSAFTAIASYQIFVDIFQRITPYINYAYQYNGVGKYNEYAPVQNDGNKQRRLDIANYIIPGYPSVGDDLTINNFQRESSVYLKTQKTLPFVDSIPGVPQDNTRFTLGDEGLCETPTKVLTKQTSAYYASIKKLVVNQYGQIGSYESVDTGFQEFFVDTARSSNPSRSIFGGDIYINRFGFKSKLPFFFDDRVGDIDGADIDYTQIGNVGSPKYYFSSALSFQNGQGPFSSLNNLFGVPVVKLDCLVQTITYSTGKMYINAIGIPFFYCESEVNVDYRQAFNDKEGDFYPRVGEGIPDNWLQPINVSMNYDNTYYYNKTLSKQNKENSFTTLPVDYKLEECRSVFPFRAVFSEARTNDQSSNQRNNWLIYKPISYFDFPQNYGKLTSLDGMQNKQVLARFENRTQIYNALLTAPTSQANVYLGQSLFDQKVPPIDIYITDQGFAGSRHRFLLRTEYGVIYVDDKRGHVFLIGGNTPKNLTDMSSGVEQFFNRNLEVKLPTYFPTMPVDNTYNGVGITGVFDAKYNRLILTKIDYEPLNNAITYRDGKFYVSQRVDKILGPKDIPKPGEIDYVQTEIQLGDPEYFCNKSFTISYDFETQSWISFHSYLPNWYVGSNNFFLSGRPGDSWRHSTTLTFCLFYNEQADYILEYPYAFQYQDEILQSVADYSKTFQYVDGYPIEVNDVYFNKAILYNNQQCSGVLNLDPKPRNNLNQYMKYPIYNLDSKTILYTKSDNLYKINQFWSLVKDIKQPLFKKTCQSLSYDKVINQDNMNYSKMAFKKSPLRAKDLKCRFILDNRTDTRIVSQLMTIETQKSFK